LNDSVSNELSDFVFVFFALVSLAQIDIKARSLLLFELQLLPSDLQLILVLKAKSPVVPAGTQRIVVEIKHRLVALFHFFLPVVKKERAII
jgi:hypothetical protein